MEQLLQDSWYLVEQLNDDLTYYSFFSLLMFELKMLRYPEEIDALSASILDQRGKHS